MGIIQCGTFKDKTEIMNIIEKSINNKKTTLDKKIYEEYYSLKDSFKPHKKLDRSNSKEKAQENFNNITKKKNFISVKKRMNRFIKWYLMSHPNQEQNLNKSKRNSISETKFTSNNNNINKVRLDTMNNNYYKNANANLKKNQSEENLKSYKNADFNISPISGSNFNNKTNKYLNSNNDFGKSQEQVNFNNTLRISNLNINNNEISPIANNKKVQFMIEKESDKINENLNNKFKSITANISNCSYANNNGNSSNNEEVYNSFLNNKQIKSLQSNLVSSNNATKLSTTLTMPHIGINKNSNYNNTININNNKNISNLTNLNAKIKITKTDSCVKIIPKPNTEINNNNNNVNYNNDNKKIKNAFEDINKIKNIYHISNINSNQIFIANENVSESSSRNADLKKTSTTNTNANSNTLNFNNQNNNSADNLSSNKSNIIDKSSTTALMNNRLSLSKTLNTKSNSNNNLNINLNSKEDSNSNNTQQTENEKNNMCLSNNICNSSQENDFHSNSILVQQLNIFDDSNIIDSNLRLFFKLNKEKFLKRVSKGPPNSFRWVSWLIASNLPFERSKEFYSYLLTQQLSYDTDIQIKKDLNRTLSGIKISPNFLLDDTQLILYNILKAFALVDKEVSYCQGMNFIVGFLLVISDFNELETFYFMLAIFSTTFKDNLGIRGFFLEGFPLLNFYVDVFLNLFNKFLPELKKHFEKLEIPDEVWISKWFRTLFTLSLPFEICMRIWDCLLIYGLDFLLNFTLAFMKHIEPDLLKKQDIFDVIEFFKKMSPFFAMENEGEEALIAESNKFIEAFNIEEIINNAKKIKISAMQIKDQMKTFEKTHKVNFERLKVKYDLGFQSDNFSNFYCESNINVDDIRENIFVINNVNNGNFNANDNKFNDGDKNEEFYINTDTCRSEIEKIRDNLEHNNFNLNSNLNINSFSKNNYNMQVYTENKLQKLPSTESSQNISRHINNNNINVIENEIIQDNSFKKCHNNSEEIDYSPTNSDTELISDDIQDKITNYTFKPRFNINGIHKRFDVMKDGKID